MIEIKVYSLDGCVDTPATIQLIKKIAKEKGCTAKLSHIKISSSEDAERHRFPGSPTVRMNGQDIEPAMRDTNRFGMS